MAILFVIALHWSNSRINAAAASPLDEVFLRVAGHGVYGVTLFFLLSGFLITRTLLAREPNLFALSLRDFYVRRIARIQPLFLVAVVSGLVILRYGGDPATRLIQYTFHDPAASYGAEFLASLLSLTYNWEMILHRDEFSFRGLHWDVMWSLAVEEQFYLFFPLLILWSRGRKRLLARLWGLVGLGIAVRLGCDMLHAGLLVKTFNSFSCFDTLALGVLCALLSGRLPRGPKLCAGLAVLGSLLIGLAMFRGGIALLILGGLFVIHGASRHDPFTLPGFRGFWAKPLARLGQLSYGLYLLHATALYLAAPLLAGAPLLPGFLLLVGVSYVLAEIADRVIETPASRWIRSRFLASPRPVAVTRGIAFEKLSSGER